MVLTLLPIVIVGLALFLLLWALFRREQTIGDLRMLIGGLVGALAGLVWGAFVPLYLYLLITTPKGTPWGNMDQAGLIMLVTGPLGGIIGAVFGVYAFRHRLRPLVILIILASVGIILVLRSRL